MKSVLITGGLGYIGSRVYSHLASSRLKYAVHSLDLEWFPTPFPGGVSNLHKNFSEVTKEFVQEFDIVIHLAGHSSVPFCDADPRGSLRNNCIDFFRFVDKLRDDQRFLYASSGSVYGFSGDHACRETDQLPAPIRHYDLQKQAIDMYMERSNKHFYGMRFGTVCGYSPNPRNELMINAMVRSAKQRQQINIRAGDSFRAVLGLNDLCRAVEALIETDAAPGFYNLASFNDTIAGIATQVAWETTELIYESQLGSPYSFQLNTDKFVSLVGMNFRDNVRNIAARCAKNDFSVERRWDIER